MEIKARLLAQVKWNYSLVYDWLIENRVLIIEKAKGNDQHWADFEDKTYTAYSAEIEKLVSPKNATLEQIKRVAGLVVYGLFETHYQEQAGDFILGEIGRNILNIINEIEKFDEEVQLQENVLTTSSTIYKIDADYFEAAEGVYSEIFMDNERNIGGRVALADTNWEFQKLVGDSEKILFRKAHLLKFSEIEQADNLFQLTLNNQIRITSITVI